MTNIALKKLALKLLSFRDDDQHWIISQLSDSERQKIEILISEIKLLGLEIDEILLDKLLKDDKLILENDITSDLNKYATIWIVLSTISSEQKFKMAINGRGISDKPQFELLLKKYEHIQLPVSLKRAISEIVSA